MVDVGLELNPEGRGALICREKTISQNRRASMKPRYRKCSPWEIMRRDLGSGQGEFVLGGEGSRKSN